MDAPYAHDPATCATCKERQGKDPVPLSALLPVALAHLVLHAELEAETTVGR